MQWIYLRFPSVQSLWKFHLETGINNFDVNTHARRLGCPCTPGQVSLALNRYYARVHERQLLLPEEKPLPIRRVKGKRIREASLWKVNAFRQALRTA